LATNQGVVGSNPAGRAIHNNGLRHHGVARFSFGYRVGYLSGGWQAHPPLPQGATAHRLATTAIAARAARKGRAICIFSTGRSLLRSQKKPAEAGFAFSIASFYCVGQRIAAVTRLTPIGLASVRIVIRNSTTRRDPVAELRRKVRILARAEGAAFALEVGIAAEDPVAPLDTQR
jgi:hypothetical protein